MTNSRPPTTMTSTIAKSSVSTTTGTSASRRPAYRRDLVCVDDFREAARRRLPRPIFDFIDGAAGHEITARANEEAFRRYVFRPQVLTDVSGISTATSVLGRRVELPIFLGPSGMQRLVVRDGELSAVRAAERMGTVYILSAASSRTLEQVAAAAPAAMRWFQVFLWNTREWVQTLLHRAEAAGYDVLCLTVDTKSPGGRKYRDLRNGLSNPRIDPRSTIAAISHPRWLREFVLGGAIRSAHLLDDVNNRSVSLFRSPGFLQRRMDPTATWDEVSWIRSIWKGPLVIKGILTAEDARSCFERGADAIVCSNHGGRVLDGNPATLVALPRLVDVAESFKKEVYIDGGIRTGGDVVKALALGARACLIGRPFWWGLAVAGEDGAVQVLDLLKKEIESTLTQIGRPSLEALERAAIEEAQI
jgi:isopentenyl diphosphate isomerase/L-lactate dehydrogenase-like FMN-dependent dehydrogenase